MSRLKERLQKTASNNLNLPEWPLIESYVEALKIEMKGNPNFSKLNAEQQEEFLKDGLYNSMTQFHHMSEFEFLFNAVEEAIVRLAKTAVDNAADIMVDEFLEL